jgi:hypothetical protein
LLVQGLIDLFLGKPKYMKNGEVCQKEKNIDRISKTFEVWPVFLYEFQEIGDVLPYPHQILRGF